MISGRALLKASCKRWWCRLFIGPRKTEVKWVPYSAFDAAKGEYVSAGGKYRIYCLRCKRGAPNY